VESRYGGGTGDRLEPIPPVLNFPETKYTGSLALLENSCEYVISYIAVHVLASMIQ
jgi:hypothetical protein